MVKYDENDPIVSSLLGQTGQKIPPSPAPPLLSPWAQGGTGDDNPGKLLAPFFKKDLFMRKHVFAKDSAG